MNDDINIRIGEYILNCRAVSIIIKDDKILFQKRKGDIYYALPGGKIKLGESSKDAIKRELEEELDIKNFYVDEDANVSEYFFQYGNDKYHQYIFCHKVYISDEEWIFGREEFDGIEEQSNLIFKWFNIKTIDKEPIRPNFLKKQLIKKEKSFFISYREY